MFNIGFTELLILGVIALIFIGPNQLPEVARTIGRLLNEWKRATSDFQNSIHTHVTQDVRDRWNETRQLQQQQDEAAAFAEHIGSPADGFGHAPTDHQVAEKVETETPSSTHLPEGADPVRKHES